MPVIMAPPCFFCGLPCLEAPCEKCSLSACAHCLPCPNCESTRESTPRTVVEEVETGSTGSTQEHTVTHVPTLYDQLREAAGETIDLGHGRLVRREISLSEHQIEDELCYRAFGVCLFDFTRLCRQAAVDYPGGLVLLSLETNRTIIFLQNYLFYEAQYCAASTALKMMQDEPGAFGLAARKVGDKLVYEVFAVVSPASPDDDDEEDEEEEDVRSTLLETAEALEQIVASWCAK